MNITSTSFIGSFVENSKCPKDRLPEFAFVGRSNVGKSTLINFLTNKKSLARVSNTPGKTQTLNFYLINKSWYLVDLPGYGYAKISKSERRKWGKMIQNYLLNREKLAYVFLLIDSRIAPQKIDFEFMNWLGENQIPFAITYTKADFPKKNEFKKRMKTFETEILKNWEMLPIQFVTSSKKRDGNLPILQLIKTTVKLFGK